MNNLGLDFDGKWFLSNAVEKISDKLHVPRGAINLVKYSGEGREYSAEFVIFSSRYSGLSVKAHLIDGTEVGLSFWESKHLKEVVK